MTAFEEAVRIIEAADPAEAVKAWAQCGCDGMDPGLALVVIDAALSHGPERAARWLQTAVGEAADGVIGPTTLAAIARADPLVTLTRVQAQCTRYEATRMSSSQDEMPAG